MKRILIFIFILMFSSMTFSVKPVDEATYKLTVVVPDNGIDYKFYSDLYDPDYTDDFLFILGAGFGSGNKEEVIFNYTSGPDEADEDGYVTYSYDVLIKGNHNSENRTKIVIYYFFPVEPEETVPANFVDSDILNEEYRFMVGNVDAKNEDTVASRKYIEYSDIDNFLTTHGVPANMEYNLPLGGVDVNAYPRYTYGKGVDPLYDSFKNGNVVTHLYRIEYDDPATTEDDETVVFYTDRYYATGTTDLNTDGLKEWYTDHIVSVDTDHDPDNGKYYRGYLTIIKYLFFEPQDATNTTPPNGVIQNLRIKARTNGSNRQRTSSVEINAGGYTEVITSDPNPFKITEMEERGK